MKDLEGQMKKHLSLRAGLLLVESTKEHLLTAGYRLLHNAKPQDHGLPHEGKGYDDVVVKQVYRAVHALEKAGWEIHRRSWRLLGERVKKHDGTPFEDLPEKNPNATDFSKFLPKIKHVTVMFDGLVELETTLKALKTYLAAQGGHAPTGELLKQVKKGLQFLEGVIEIAEKDAP